MPRIISFPSGPYLALPIVLLLVLLIPQDTSATHTVDASPLGGTYDSPQFVTLSSSNASATIYFTLDGSEPNIGSTQYNGTEITISSNTTLKFKAVEPSDNHTSAVVTETYVISLPTPTVINTVPEDGDRRIGIFDVINATFSLPMNESTINSDTFTVVSQADGSAALGSVTYEAVTDTASFTPDPFSPLQYGVRYVVTLSEDIRDISGSPLGRTSWNFTTGGQLTIVLEDVQSFALLPGSTFTITPNPFTGNGSLDVEDNGIYDSDLALYGSRFDGDIILDNVDNSFLTYSVSESVIPDGYSTIYGDLLVTVVDADACFDGACPTTTVVVFENILSIMNIADVGFPVNVPPPGLNSSQFELYRDQVLVGRFSGIAGSLALPTFNIIADPHSGSTPYGSLVTTSTFDGVGPETIIFPFTAPAGSTAHDLFTTFQIPTYPSISEDVIAPDVIYVIPPVAIPYEETRDNFILTPIIDGVSPGLIISMHQLSYVESQVARFEKVNMTFAVPGNNIGFSFGITDTPPLGTPEPPLDAPALFLDVGFVGDVDFSNPAAFEEPPKIDILVNKTLEGFDQLPDGCSDFVMLLFDEDANKWTEIEKLRTPTLDTGDETPNDPTDDKCGFTLSPPHFSKFAVGGARGQTVSTESVLPLAGHHGGGGGGSSSVQQMVSGTNVERETKVGSDSVVILFDIVESGSGQLKISTADVVKFNVMFDEIVTQEGDKMGIINLDSSVFSTAGNIFDIDASAVRFDGMVKVTIPYDEKIVQSSGSESNVRFLHYDQQEKHWEDATVAFDTENNTVTGMVDSLSPVVAAVVDDGTFSLIYFEMNPVEKVVAEAHSNVIEKAQKGVQTSIPVTIKNVQRASQQYAVIVQILDEDGVARYISWQSGALTRSQSTEVSSSWTPEKEGNYTIQIFVWDDIDSPSALSKVYVMRTVVS